MEFAFKYEMFESLKHEKFPDTHVLDTLLTENALLFNGKKISRISGTNKLFQNFQMFGGMGHTGVLANFKTKNSEMLLK